MFLLKAVFIKKIKRKLLDKETQPALISFVTAK